MSKTEIYVSDIWIPFNCSPFVARMEGKTCDL